MESFAYKCNLLKVFDVHIVLSDCSFWHAEKMIYNKCDVEDAFSALLVVSKDDG